MTKKKAQTKRKPKAEALAGSPSSEIQVPPVLPPGEYPIHIDAAKYKVAILGTTPHRQQAPFDDPSWQIWGVGPAMHDMVSNTSGVIRRCDRWFEVHDPDMWVTGPTADEHSKNTYLPWLRSIGPKAMILRPHEVLPDASIIPVEQIVKTFGANSAGFIKGSIEWCIAVALLEYQVNTPGQLEAMGAFGVDYASTAERIEQKAGLRHWMDKCHTMGVKFQLPVGSDMNAVPKPYPFNEETPLYKKALYRKQELQSRINAKSSTADQLRKDLRAVEDELQQLSGAMQNTDFWMSNDWM